MGKAQYVSSYIIMMLPTYSQNYPEQYFQMDYTGRVRCSWNETQKKTETELEDEESHILLIPVLTFN